MQAASFLVIPEVSSQVFRRVLWMDILINTEGIDHQLKVYVCFKEKQSPTFRRFALTANPVCLTTLGIYNVFIVELQFSHAPK